jgi:hypothetical protein
LKTLVDFNGRKPAINIAYFPNTQSSVYWSSTTDNRDWSKLVDFGNGPDVGFDDGYNNINHKNYGGYARAVRGGQ